MSDHSSVDEVSSGAPYRVVTVNDQPTADLEALLPTALSGKTLA